MMQIEHRVVGRMQQDGAEAQQTAQALLCRLRINPDNLHILRPVHEERHQEGLRQDREPVLRIRAGRRIDHRNCHGDIADGRKADD